MFVRVSFLLCDRVRWSCPPPPPPPPPPGVSIIPENVCTGKLFGGEKGVDVGTGRPLRYVQTSCREETEMFYPHRGPNISRDQHMRAQLLKCLYGCRFFRIFEMFVRVGPLNKCLYGSVSEISISREVLPKTHSGPTSLE